MTDDETARSKISAEELNLGGGETPSPEEVRRGEEDRFRIHRRNEDIDEQAELDAMLGGPKKDSARPVVSEELDANAFRAYREPILNPSFSYLESVLNGMTIQDLGEKYHVPIKPVRAVTLDDKETYVAADTHGCLTDIQHVIRTFVSDLVQGKDSQLILLGDYIHGLKKLDGNRKPTGPAYKDESVQVLAQVLELRRLFGDRVVPLLADHEMCDAVDDYTLEKFGEQLQNSLRTQMSSEEHEKLQKALKELPLAARLPTGFVFAHAGAAPMARSWKELEELEVKPIEGRNFHDWANNTIEGRLLEGTYTDRKEKIIRHEEVKEFLKRMKARCLVTGHYGIATFLHERKGVTQKHTGVNRFLDLESQIILATTEGNGVERGRDASETNMYGAKFCFARGDDSTLFHADLDADKFRRTGLLIGPKQKTKGRTTPIEKTELALKTKKQSPIQATAVSGIDEFEFHLDRLHGIKGLPSRIHESYKAQMPALRQRYETDVIFRDAVHATTEYLKSSKTREVPDTILYQVQDDVWLNKWSPALQAYAKRGK